MIYFIKTNYMKVNTGYFVEKYEMVCKNKSLLLLIRKNVRGTALHVEVLDLGLYISLNYHLYVCASFSESSTQYYTLGVN